MPDLLDRVQASLALVILCTLVSAVIALFCYAAIPRAAPHFVAAGLRGADLSKPGRPVIAESMGMLCGLFYMLALFVLIPFAFFTWAPSSEGHPQRSSANWNMFSSYLSAVLSIQSMLFLGFADDVLNIKWRYKLFLPAFASIPLLLIYIVQDGATHVVLPKLAFFNFFSSSNVVDLGRFYYVYMAMVAIFCTNSINIYAGVNGIEVSQSLVIACATALFNARQIFAPVSDTMVMLHTLSLVLLLPFIAVALVLLRYNWYPARVFVGDTFTYFSGMVLAVASILGHFSKTMLLFHIPQIFNFIFSAPQLFALLPCPRHRLPKFNENTGLLECSVAQVSAKNLSRLGRIVLNATSTLGLVNVTKEIKDDEEMLSYTNLTLLNVYLLVAKKFGRTSGLSEPQLAKVVVSVQVVNCFVAFFIRIILAGFFYS